MTTYQEPLQSRRAARAGERADAENNAVDSAANPQSADSESSASAAATGHTAAGHLAPEPLTYSTTSRPPLPQYDGQSLRPRRTVEPAEQSDLPPTEALPDHHAPTYRARDFSPEGRRAAAPGAVPPAAVPTGGTAAVDSAPAAPASDPAPSAPVAAEHTMTRRELRALREANGGVDPVFVAPVPVSAPAPFVPVDFVPAPPVEEPAAEVPAVEEPPAEMPASLVEPEPTVAPAPQPSSRLDSALAEFDALAAGREPNIPSPDAPAPVTGRRAAPAAEPAAFVIPPEPDFEAPVSETPVSETSAVESPAVELEPATDAAFDAILESAIVDPEPDVYEPAVFEVPVFEVPVYESPVVEAPVLEAPEQQSAPEAQSELIVEAEPDADPEAEPEGLSAFDSLFQPPVTDAVDAEAVPNEAPAPSAADQLLAPPAAEAIAIEPAVAEQAVVEAPALAQEPLSTVDPLLAAPAPQGAPALVPPPPAPYPTAVDLPVPPATPAPITIQPASIHDVTQPVEPLTPAIGHWSTQSDIDDAEQVNDSTLSRILGAGNGAITTSALVLPSSPEHAIGGPLGSNGEILLTGSISLPGSLSELGAHPSQLDESDIDHLLDPGDHQVANTDSTPVRAIRAVSTHTASGGIIAPSKPKGTRGFTILIIAASVMAVVVVGLLVAGLVSGTL